MRIGSRARRSEPRAKVRVLEATRDGKAVLYRVAPEFRAHCRAKGIDFGCCRLLF